MKIFVTGANGFLGSRLAIRLAENGHMVHALYRSETNIETLVHPNIKLFKGDILDFNSLLNAVSGCSQIYHTAAFTKILHKNTSLIYRLNIEGSMNVIRAGLTEGVKRFVCTSTAGVLGPSGLNEYIDEDFPNPGIYFLDYEYSKAILEEVLKTIALKGVEIIIVNPTRIYGPGLLSESNGVTRLIKKYIQGKWRFIPGNGKSIGNYVFVEDVVTGHILAMEKGKSGERYLLGGENLTYLQLFNILSGIIGKKITMIRIPVFLTLLISWNMQLINKITGFKPSLTPSLVRKFNHNWMISSKKAEEELGYHPLEFISGAKITIDWLCNE